ncbi:hypothetical protein K456DRAFT_1851221 [Colletotrichum gloeosporioides 23]|nr:hypothetical protein K456DRAFT_1851221 [Colletotrichum gloeosporioides 23]
MKASRGKRQKTFKRTRNHDVELLIRRARGLYDIPREILLIVANELPTNFRTALALACKGFFKSICPDGRLPRMERAEAIEFVLLLDRDAIARGDTNLFPCFGCARLQPFRRDDHGNWSTQVHAACDFVVRFINSYVHRPFNLRPVHGCNGASNVHQWIEPISTVIWKPAVRGLGGNEPAITFAEARLVMDNHFLGGSRGISIERLENSFQFNREIPPDDDDLPTAHFPLEQHVSKTRYNLRPRFGARRERLGLLSRQNAAVWSFTHKTSAKVIDDELFIRRHHDILGPPCTLEFFVKIMDSPELPVCRHILGCSHAQLLGTQASACIAELHSLRIIQTDSQWDIHPDQGIASCSICSTDYEISIERGSNQRNWGLKLTTCHKLGQCRTPDDPLWKNLVGFMPATDSRYVIDVPGTVRQAWLKQHGEIDTASSNLSIEWVMIQQCMIMKRFSCFSTRRFDGRKALWRIMNAAHPGPRLINNPGMVLYTGLKRGGEMLD